MAEVSCGKLAFRLYKSLSVDPGNKFFAPFGVLNVISMLLPGADEQTASQILNALDFTGKLESDIHSENMNLFLMLIPKSEDLTLKFCNCLFFDASCTLEEEFLKKCRKFYLAEVTGFDFISSSENAKGLISQQIERLTYGNIKNILQDCLVDSTTRLVLASAVCFRGSWELGFPEDLTHSAKFFKKKGSFFRKDKVSAVSMMKRQGEYDFFEDKRLHLQFLSVPYAGGEASFYILLPIKRFGLKRVEKKLTYEKLHNLMSKAEIRKVKLYLPKMKFHQTIDLAAVMKTLGVSDVFDSTKANLSRLSSHKSLSVSCAIQKTFMEINEQGAVSYTLTESNNQQTKKSFRKGDRGTVTVRCDHPFLFIIAHRNTKAILFCGRYSDPPTPDSLNAE